MKKIFSYLRFIVLPGVLLISVLSSCSGSSTQATFNSETAASRKMEHELSYQAGYAGEVSWETSMDGSAPQASASPLAEGGALTLGGDIPSANVSRKLIRNAVLSIETTSFDELITDIRRTVDELGGYIEDSNVSGNSLSSTAYNRRYAYFMTRIPADKLEPFITLVGERGNITSKAESVQDVTLQYSDIESWKKSLTVEQERLWSILEKAETLEAVVALEARLSEIRYQLESYESRLRHYDNQVDYATVTLNIQEVQVFTPISPDSVAIRIQKGFSRNLNSLSQGLVSFTVWFISSLPTLVVFAVFAGIVTVIVRKAIKNKPGKKKQTEEPPKNHNAS